jgi:chlorite dismutase
LEKDNLMPETTPRTLNHFAFFRFKDVYSTLSSEERQGFRADWLAGLRQAAEPPQGTSNVDVYQVYPAETSADVLVWSAMEADEPDVAAGFFERFARATNPQRHLVEAVHTLWGLTKPSQYTKTRSTQEIDPFSAERKPYLIVYPFVKTADWYLLFGLQDQEFIVVYETDDLGHFSDLVYVLRDTEARRYTQRDAPLFTAVYHSPEQTLSLWE